MLSTSSFSGLWVCSSRQERGAARQPASLLQSALRRGACQLRYTSGLEYASSMKYFCIATDLCVGSSFLILVQLHLSLFWPRA